MHKHTVVSIGSALQDTFMKADEGDVIAYKESASGKGLVFPLGAKLEVKLMQQEIGGAGTNTAVLFSRLGLNAAIITRVGKDYVGRAMREHLQAEGVVAHHMVIDQYQATGKSMLLIAPDGNRTILISRGASKAFEADDIDEMVIKNTEWVYLSAVGGDLKVLKRIFALVDLYDVKIAWNPGGMELEHGAEALGKLLRRTNVLLVNREEAAKLIGQKRPTVDVAMKKLISMISEGVIVLTDGSEGASVYDGDEIISMPGRDVPVVDATGAGDAFGSGFVGAVISGAPLPRALSFAMSNAESVIGQIGAQAGLLRKLDLKHQRAIQVITHQLPK